jgi:hypothetical protein
MSSLLCIPWRIWRWCQAVFVPIFTAVPVTFWRAVGMHYFRQRIMQLWPNCNHLALRISNLRMRSMPPSRCFANNNGTSSAFVTQNVLTIIAGFAIFLPGFSSHLVCQCGFLHHLRHSELFRGWKTVTLGCTSSVRQGYSIWRGTKAWTRHPQDLNAMAEVADALEYCRITWRLPDQCDRQNTPFPTPCSEI